MINLLENMNPDQQEAITADDGPVMVIAGPGSGKTRVLTHRIAYLIMERDVQPYRIMAVTFTNKAAREMKERVQYLIGNDASYVTLGTFHAICMRILRREYEHTAFPRDFVIYDTKDQRELVKRIFKELHLNNNNNNATPAKVLSAISAVKNENITPEKMIVNNYDAEIVQRVYVEYDAQLRNSGARDFDDLLTHTVRLFRKYPMVLEKYHKAFQYVLVDEFQDTNMVQYELIKQLGGESKNLFVVGDPDQSIYAFRGADYRNVKRFQQEFSPQLVALRQNYRSHQLILDAAMAVIRKNPDHIRRDLFSERKDGDKIIVHEAYSEREEAQYVLEVIETAIAKGTRQLSDFAVLYRVNSQSRTLEDAFVRAGMPYILVGATRFYGRKEVKDIVAYLRLINNPRDIVSLERVINVPPRGIGPKSVAQLMSWADALHDGVWEAFQILARGDESPLTGRARTTVTAFANMIVDLQSKVEASTSLELLDAILEATGYLDFLQRDESGAEREDNVNELRRGAHEKAHLPLSEFLAEIALVSDIDNLNTERGAPTLLTFHAAKGLEFPVVFMVGLEEGILPHRRSIDDPSQMAEERRLMYVGLTRAKDQVHLLYAFRRMMVGWGQEDMSMVSRFVEDIPPVVTGVVKNKKAERNSFFDIPKWDTSWQPSRNPRNDAPTPTETTLKRGQKVRHAVYGEGIVINTNGSSGLEIATVLFQQHGEKKLDASFLEAME